MRSQVSYRAAQGSYNATHACTHQMTRALRSLQVLKGAACACTYLDLNLMPGQQHMVREEYLIPSCAQSLTQTPASVQECVQQASQVA